MAQSDVLQSKSVNFDAWQSPPLETASPSAKPPSWLVASVTEFLLTQRILNVVRPIRAVSFGGVLVFVTLLMFLLWHSPDGQTALLVVSLYGLPICVAAWLVAAAAQRRLGRAKNHIEQRVYGAGLHLDEEGRALTDNPHPILILDAATGRASNMS